MRLMLFNNQQNQGAGNAATGAAFDSGNISIEDFYNYCVNGFPTNFNWSKNSTRMSSLAQSYSIYHCEGNNSNNYVPSGWVRSVQPGVRILVNISESAFYEQNLVGNRLRIEPGFVNSNVVFPNPADYHFVTWEFIFPVLTGSYGSDFDIPDSGHYWWPLVDNIDFCTNSFSISDISFSEIYFGGSSCSDSRSSGANQMIDIGITGNFGGVSTTFNYSLGFPTPSSDVVNVSVSVPSSMRLRFDEFVNCNASFSGGVVRNDGILEIYGQLTGYGVGLLVDSGVVDDEVLICQLSFNACCDDSVTFTDSISDYLSSLMTDYSEFIGDVEIKKFVYSGFGSLSNYCCDDVSCSDDESFDFDDNSTIKDGGSGGGGGDSGDDTDVTCICDNLESLIDLLSDKLTSLTSSVTSLNNGLASIVSAVSGLDVNNTSIASAINNKVIPVSDTSSIVTAINNKVIPVSVVDTGSIASAINNKVIPVSDNSGVVSGLGNLNSDLLGINSSLGQINTGIAGQTSILDGDLDIINSSIGSLTSAVGGVEQAVSSSSAVDGLVCTDSNGNEEGLACIIKNALNNRDGKGLADVVDDKETSSYVDVAIEPYDLVNIRRAFNDDDLREG